MNLAATHPELRAVCIAGAFASWQSIASDHIPAVGPLLIPSGIDARTAAAQLAGRPLLIVHGDQDRVVPPHHARAIEAVARDSGADVTCMIVPGADHNGLVSKHLDVQQAIGDFFVAGLVGVNPASQVHSPVDLVKQSLEDGP